MGRGKARRSFPSEGVYEIFIEGLVYIRVVLLQVPM
jgi:hypothetical protein